MTTFNIFNIDNRHALLKSAPIHFDILRNIVFVICGSEEV